MSTPMFPFSLASTSHWAALEIKLTKNNDPGGLPNLSVAFDTTICYQLLGKVTGRQFSDISCLDMSGRVKRGMPWVYLEGCPRLHFVTTNFICINMELVSLQLYVVIVIYHFKVLYELLKRSCHHNYKEIKVWRLALTEMLKHFYSRTCTWIWLEQLLSCALISTI